MKTAALIALLAPATCWGLVGITWKFENEPTRGLKDVTFPFNMTNAPHESGFYFAQQFNFKGVPDVGYTGLQPRKDNSGGSVVHGVFSSFQKGTTSSHRNCHGGADGKPGVSCAVDINASYSPTYNLVVENTSGTSWRGTLIDASSGKKTIIGEWTLPSGALGIKSSQVGFVEFYPWNAGPHKCKNLPKTQVTFGKPTSETGGTGPGFVGDAYEYGDCKGKVGFKMTTTGEGVRVDVGF
ncbi:hypothetical protein TOPH_08317 [Tolypocladium ophioglossoides CBS 100239]|uniref:Uncharacterized protein n=1 Tax=Tolypocladium ophioglossoides (strain CBS 100239) TaxID=1163406 RepID=A0A0L0MZY4_TOLOC|nr:hypothetical protein TOPH_08317 [Tolypocladium ophioglossoides CBS 100239]